MATEIKIQLATYLKDAGIRASQEQIEQLAQKVKKANREAKQSADDLGGALGKLPGPLGKLQNAFGGVLAKGLAVFAAFKTGCDIGNWVVDKVLKPLGWIEDAAEKHKRQNRELAQQAKEAAEKWNGALADWERGWQHLTHAADGARQKIEDVTAAYLRMQQAREKVQGSADNAGLLALERDKFNAMANAGTPEEAAVSGKYYDVLIAEEKVKQELARFDREAETQARKNEAAENALHKATERRATLKRQMVELDRKLDYFQSQASVQRYGFDKSAQEEAKLQAKKDALQAQIDAADRDVAKRKTEREAVALEATATPQARANLAARAQLEIDEKKKAHDDYLDEIEVREREQAQREVETMQQQVRQEQAARERMERELAQQRLNDLRTELAERQRAESDARSRQSAAGSGLQQAWGWYRDKTRMQAVIDEQKAQALAEVQWAKDFDRLKSFRKDWRTVDFGQLSAADEAVRQVAFAKEEKAAADRAVIETAQNTRDMAAKIDELLTMK